MTSPAQVIKTRLPDPPLVENMPELVGYLARRIGLEAADPAFI